MQLRPCSLSTAAPALQMDAFAKLISAETICCCPAYLLTLLEPASPAPVPWPLAVAAARPRPKCWLQQNTLLMLGNYPAALITCVTASMSSCPVLPAVAAARLHLVSYHDAGVSCTSPAYLQPLSLPACPAAWRNLLWQLPLCICCAGISCTSHADLQLFVTASMSSCLAQLAVAAATLHLLCWHQLYKSCRSSAVCHCQHVQLPGATCCGSCHSASAMLASAVQVLQTFNC
jgi:hypothetical protein